MTLCKKGCKTPPSFIVPFLSYNDVIHRPKCRCRWSIPDFPHGAQSDGVAHGMKAGGAERLEGVGEGVHARPRSQRRRQILNEARILWREARLRCSERLSSYFLQLLTDSQQLPITF